MVVRMLTANEGFGTRNVDDLQAYLIDDLTDDTFDYESLNSGIHFQSHRIDCSKLSLAPTA